MPTQRTAVERGIVIRRLHLVTKPQARRIHPHTKIFGVGVHGTLTRVIDPCRISRLDLGRRRTYAHE